MKEIYENYKNEMKNKNRILIIVMIVFILGLIFGSLYITILSNDEKTVIIKKVNNFFINSSKLKIDNKIEIFKESLISNLIYFISMWLLGLSVIGIPIIVLMIFFKSFTIGFSVGSIFACFKAKGILGILLYIFPNTILTSLFSIFLSAYSLILALRLINYAFYKKTLNFRAFMGKYFFLLLLSILLSVFCAFIDAFLSPSILNLFTNFIK